MGRASRVDQFKIGDHVEYMTDVGYPVFKPSTDKKGKPISVFSHNVHIPQINKGKISKLHKSGRQGVAEIFPENGGKKISRRLQHVDKHITL